MVQSIDARVGLIGATGAGKSTLIAAIAAAARANVTLVDGVGELHTTTSRRRCTLVDAPAARVPAVIAQGLDGAILVVSSAQSIMPATRDHLERVKNARAPIVAAYVTMPPGMDLELAELVELEVVDLLKSFETDAPIIRGGANVAPDGDVLALARALDQWTPARER